MAHLGITINEGEALYLVPPTRYFKGVNHRGYNGTAPENTIPAYILSKKKGFDMVECDVAFTSDNVCVLLHDATINRTSNGTGAIASMTFAQVRQYDFGSWKNPTYAGTKIPSLEEFLVCCRNLGLHPYIEIKSDTSYTDQQIAGIVSLVEAYGMKGKVSYISFSSSYLAKVKTADPYARLGFVVNGVTDSVVSTAVSLRSGTNEVFIDSKTSTAQEVARCKAAFIPLEVWVRNTEQEILALDDYISGVTSDSLDAGALKLCDILP